jgi:hypothetical protein
MAGRWSVPADRHAEDAKPLIVAFLHRGEELGRDPPVGACRGRPLVRVEAEERKSALLCADAGHSEAFDVESDALSLQSRHVDLGIAMATCTDAFLLPVPVSLVVHP